MEQLIKGHQGDVIFAQIAEIPEGAVATSNRPIATGSSGHAHALTGNVQRFELSGRVFFKVSGAATLQHVDASLLTDAAYSSAALLPEKDHHPHAMPEGCYEFYIQKSYNPFSKALEAVQD